MELRLCLSAGWFYADEKLTAFLNWIGGETGLGQRHEVGLVRPERAPEICSTKGGVMEKTERKSPKTSLSFNKENENL